MERIKNLGLRVKVGIVVFVALLLVLIVLVSSFKGYLNRELEALYGAPSAKGEFVSQLLRDDLEPFTREDPDVQDVQQMIETYLSNYGIYGLRYIFLLNDVEDPDVSNVIADTLKGRVSNGLIKQNVPFDEEIPCQSFKSGEKMYYDCGAFLRLPEKEQGVVRVGILAQNQDSEVWAAFREKHVDNVFSWTFWIIAFLLIILMSVLLTLAFWYLLLRRIVAISQATERMSFGDLETEVNVKSQDEIGTLEETLERMRANLKDAIERLKRRK